MENEFKIAPHERLSVPKLEKAGQARGTTVIQIACHAEETSLDDYDETSSCRTIEPCDVFIKLVKSCRHPNKRLFFHLSVFLSPISDACMIRTSNDPFQRFNTCFFNIENYPGPRPMNQVSSSLAKCQIGEI